MGNINCCNKPTEEKILETLEEENKDDNDNDNFPFDSSPKNQNDKIKEINEINNNLYNIYENKDLVKEGNTYKVEVKIPNQINEQKNSKNENEIENNNQNSYNPQPVNNNYNKNYQSQDNNFNDIQNQNIYIERKVEEGNLNRIEENQNDPMKSPNLFSLGFEGQQILENSDINSFGLRNSNNYNLSPNFDNSENVMNSLEQKNELQKRVIDLSLSNNNNNQIYLNNIDIENSNVNSGNNYINNIDIFNSAFTFGGSPQNNITNSNIILGRADRKSVV